MSFKRLPTSATLDELTRQQAEFVLAYVELAGKKGADAEAALIAGYGRGIRKNAKDAARELLRNPRVLSAIKEELKNKFTAGAVIGLKTLVELCEKGPATVRLQAARDLLDRGVGAVVKHNAHLHAEATTVEDLLDAVDAEEDQSSKRPQIAAQSDSDVVDAEWTEAAESSGQPRERRQKSNGGRWRRAVEIPDHNEES